MNNFLDIKKIKIKIKLLIFSHYFYVTIKLLHSIIDFLLFLLDYLLSNQMIS